jgi:hypothetical protein
VLDILKGEELYLSKGRMRFLADKLRMTDRILGRIISGQGIRVDPDKVDTVVEWEIPANCDLLQGFIESEGYLTDDVPGVRLQLGILSAITSDTIPFCWRHTEQRTFEDVNQLVRATRDHRVQPINYFPKVDPVRLVTDGCATRISGVVSLSQGADWKNADVAAFYSVNEFCTTELPGP